MTNSLLEETKIIQSIGYDQHEIILDIMKLHCPEGFDMDPTYNKGGFYRHAGIRRPRHIFDINPVRPECLKADCRKLPLQDSSIRSMIFDPPFMVSNHGEGQDIMHRRYSFCDTIHDLRDLYKKSISEFRRILQTKGILVFKCQDTVSGGKNHFIHVWVANEAIINGFEPVDLFIKLNKQALISGKWITQKHARKHHSYFWVFKKKR